MRWLLALVALLAGAAAATLLFGRAEHLRAVLPDALPPAFAAVQPGSGVFAGRARLEAPAVGVVEARWDWAGLSGTEARWRVVVATSGLTGDADVTVDRPWQVAALRGGRAQLDLSAIGAPGPLSGTLVFDRIDGDMAMRDGRLTRLDGAGRIESLGWGAAELGGGTFTLDADIGGGWRLQFATDGPALAVEGRLAGRIDRRAATADLTLREGGALPRDLRALLPLVAEPAAPGEWRLRQRVGF